MAAEDSSWRTAAFRNSVIAKIDEAIRQSGMSNAKNSMEMENHVFQKAKSKEEYLGFVARLILHVREMNTKKASGMGTPGAVGQGMPDPINALQTLARQGANTLSSNVGPQPGMSQGMMMGIGGPQQPGVIQQQQQQQPVSAGQFVQNMGGQRPVQNLNPMQGLQNKMSQNAMGIPQGPQGGQMVPQMPGQMQQHMAQMQQQQRKTAVFGPPQDLGESPLVSCILQQQLTQPHQNDGLVMGPGQPGQFGAPRQGNAGSNQFLRQSPTPSSTQGSVASPAAGLQSASNQMAASPALVASPSSQPVSVGGQRSIGMAPSPSSSLNTPNQGGPTPSPCNTQEEQAYRDKVRQLSKYIEPLRRMIAKMGNDDVEKLSKMKKLLEILSNPSKRMPLETLLKCEVVLEKLDLKRGEGSVAPPAPQLHGMKDHHIFNPLVEAVNSNLQSPVINHTLQRTFGPTLEALFGPEIKMLPPLSKKKRVEESTSDIADVLQGEIARLDQRFKVSLDPTQHHGSHSVRLICYLDDRHLPCVPPISVTVPEDYPKSPPKCDITTQEYSATQFLSTVQTALSSRIRKLPTRFSVSQLLDTWEMSVRQASSPVQTQVTTAAILMGL